MTSKRLDDALATLDIAVDLLEESASHALSAARSPRRRAPKGTEGIASASASAATSSSAPPASGTMGSLFSPEELTTVKQRLDDAIERLESVLETADDAR